MEIAKTFVVKASAAAAWDFLTDPRRVASCLPGAAITQQLDERTYAGTVTVKVGPVAASYKGTLRFERLDAEAHSAELVASGQDVRGKGGADMRMMSRLVERTSGETEVSVVSEVNVMGVLAQFGRGMILDVSDQMFQRFVECMRAQLEAPAAAPASGATSAAPAHNAASQATPVAEPAAAIAAPVEPPIEVLSFGSAVVGRAAARTLRRPIAWVAALVVLVAIYWWWSR
jgi:carbon monoxide dehydrogenase subunit G